MITAHELKKIICRLNGNRMNFGPYQLQTKPHAIQGSIMCREDMLVSMTAGNNGTLIIHLQDKQDKSSVSYKAEAILKPDDTIIKLYDVFSGHDSIAEVILAFMTLKEYIE